MQPQFRLDTGMTRFIPWWCKVGAKIALSRLPIDYKVFRRLSLFRHGRMDEPAYALRIFREHLDRAGLPRQLEGSFVILELGPGDSLLTALLAHAHGASHSYLVDVKHFATGDLDIYRRTATYLEQGGLHPPNIRTARSIEDVLSACNAEYLTQGLESLRSIPDASVDLVFSQAVLEHVRRHQLEDVLRELRRVLKPTGVGSHEIDFADHLGGALNNLRFSAKLWEAEWMAQSGFYTNRIRHHEMLQCFARAGFEVAVADITRWKGLPTPRERMSREFAGLAEDDLLVRTIDLVTRPR